MCQVLFCSLPCLSTAFWNSFYIWKSWIQWSKPLVIGEGNGTPLPYSCLENPMDRGAWWAAVYGSHRVGHDWSDLAAAPSHWYCRIKMKVGLASHPMFHLHYGKKYFCGKISLWNSSLIMEMSSDWRAVFDWVHGLFWDTFSQET